MAKWLRGSVFLPLLLLGNCALTQTSDSAPVTDTVGLVCSKNRTPKALDKLSTPRRVYVLEEGSKPLNTVTNGVFIGLRWNSILRSVPKTSPSTWNQATFDYSDLKLQLDRAVAAKKHVQIAVSAGVAGVSTPTDLCPSWEMLRNSNMQNLNFPADPSTSADIVSIDRALSTTGFGHCKFVLDGAKNCSKKRTSIGVVPWHPIVRDAFDATIRELGVLIESTPSWGQAVRVVKLTGINYQTFELRVPNGGGECPDPMWEATRGYSPSVAHDAIVHFQETYDKAFRCDPHAPADEARMFATAVVSDGFPSLTDGASANNLILFGESKGPQTLAGVVQSCVARFGAQCVFQNNFLNNFSPLPPLILKAATLGSSVAWQTNLFDFQNNKSLCLKSPPTPQNGATTPSNQTLCSSAANGGSEPTFLSMMRNGFCQDTPVRWLEVFGGDARPQAQGGYLEDIATATNSPSLCK